MGIERYGGADRSAASLCFKGETKSRRRVGACAVVLGTLALGGGVALVAETPPAGPTGWYWTATSCPPSNPCAWDDAANWLFQGNLAPNYTYPQTPADDAYLHLNTATEIDLVSVTIDGLDFAFSDSGGFGGSTVNFLPTMLPSTALSCDHLTLQSTAGTSTFTTALGAMIKTVD